HARRVSGFVRCAKSMRSARPYTDSGPIGVARAASVRGRSAVTVGGGGHGVDGERGAAVYGARVGTGSSAQAGSVPVTATRARPHPRPGARIPAAFYPRLGPLPSN